MPISSDVLLQFTVYVKVSNQSTAQDIQKRLNDNFGQAFANKLMINRDRVDNVTVNYIGNQVQLIVFLLMI